MIPDYLLNIDGLDLDKWFGSQVTPQIQAIARKAINGTLDTTRTRAARMIREQVNFPASYLAPSQDRLYVAKRASNNDLRGWIFGRTRPTLLSRFSKDSLVNGPMTPNAVARYQRQNRRVAQKGIKVEVKPGVARFLRSGFLIPLKSGAVGIAIRSKVKPARAYKPVLLFDDVWLLYGPSVSQILHSDRTNGGVADDLLPIAAEDLSREFWRLYELEMK